MKYHIGDRVKVREDLKIGEKYGADAVISNMLEFKGKIVTISECESEKYRIKEFGCNWTDEMFEGLAEYTYEDLCKTPIGTKITFENGETLIKKCENNNDENLHVWVNRGRSKSDDDLQKFEDNWSRLGKIIKIEEPTYTTVYEAKKDILDEKEKEYLSNVIKPFKDKVIYITKGRSAFGTKEYIFVKLDYGDGDATHLELPNFSKGTMYKGMKANREYSLKELGLN